MKNEIDDLIDQIINDGASLIQKLAALSYFLGKEKGLNDLNTLADFFLSISDDFMLKMLEAITVAAQKIRGYDSIQEFLQEIFNDQDAST